MKQVDYEEFKTVSDQDIVSEVGDIWLDYREDKFFGEYGYLIAKRTYHVNYECGASYGTDLCFLYQ